MAALPLLLGACVGAISAEDLDRDLRASGDRVSGLKHPRVFAVYASSRIEALTMLADARTEPRSEIRSISRCRLRSRKRGACILIVGGPYADLNRRIVWNAFDYHKGKALPGLVIVYASPEAPDGDLGSFLSGVHGVDRVIVPDKVAALRAAISMASRR